MYCEKVSSIVFNKDHYEFEENPEEAMWEDITKMLQVLIHNNQIVTFDSTKCQINPNLLVEEFDVEANHNATIGAFDQDTLFYLMSRGISENDSIKLLSEGLVLNNLKENYSKEKILDFIKEYWG